MNLNKVVHCADILYGSVGNGVPKENARLDKSRDGSYVVSWTENGIVHQEFLTAQEYNALISERNTRWQIWEDVYRKSQEDKKKEKELEDFKKRMERREKREKQKELDKINAQKLMPLVQQINSDYERIQYGGDSHVAKLIREFDHLTDLLDQIESVTIRNEVIKKLSFAYNRFKGTNGTVSIDNAYKYIEQLRDKVYDDPKHYKSADLTRAKKDAKRRYQNLSPFARITQLGKLNKAKTAAELDALYRDEDDIIYNDIDLEGRSR